MVRTQLKFLPEWQQILKKAWSMRLAALAALLSGAEVVLPMFSDAFPRNAFAGLSFLVVIAAMVARLLNQNGDNNDNRE